MKKHIRVFRKFWEIGEQDVGRVRCMGCVMEKVAPNYNCEIHHIKGRGMGGSKTGERDSIENLGLLCRSCHQRTDMDKPFNQRLQKHVEKEIKRKKNNDNEPDYRYDDFRDEIKVVEKMNKLR